MKKYKHKITGNIVEYNINSNSYYFGKTSNGYTYNLPTTIIENSNDWEEIIEKDYEILSFKHIYGNIYNKSYSKNKLQYALALDSLEYTENYLIIDNTINIYSIKRLSDGEIFTIGDKMYYSNHESSFNIKGCPINSFTIENNKIYINSHQNSDKITTIEYWCKFIEKNHYLLQKMV